MTRVDTSSPSRLLGIVGLVGAAALLVAACGGDDAPASSPDPTSPSVLAIDGATYISQDVTGHTLADGTVLTIGFDAGRLSANAGCNSMSGAYTVTDGALVLDGPMASTQMACEGDGVMDQELWFGEFLASSPAITQDGSTLTLTGEDVTVAFLDKKEADPDRPLEGTTWTVTGAISNEAVSSVPEGASIVFSGGTAAVSTGCNTGSAAYTVSADGSEITFEPMAMTKMACTDPELTALEAAVTAAIDGTVTVTIDAASMTLQGADAGLQLTAAE